MILSSNKYENTKLFDKIVFEKSSKYSQISVEIWQLICINLSSNDICHLMECSKQLNDTLKSDVIWSHRVINRWYGPIYYTIGGIENRIPVDHFFEVYKEHYRNDRAIDRAVLQISEMQENESGQCHKQGLVSIIEKLIGGKPENVVPELLNIRHHLTFESLYSKSKFIKDRRNALVYKLEHLNQVFVASAFLEAIQCRIVLDLLCNLYYFDKEPANIELCLLQFSAVDPHFFELCLARNHAREHTLLKLRKDQGLLEQSSFDIIKSIIKEFRSTVSDMGGNKVLTGLHTGGKIYFENALMDRAYSDESMSVEVDSEVLYNIPNNIAIVKSFCDELGVDVRVNSMLIECLNAQGNRFGVIPLDRAVSVDINILPDRVRNFEDGNRSYCTYAIENLLGISKSSGIRHSRLSRKEDINATQADSRAIIYNEFVRDSIRTFTRLCIKAFEHKLDIETSKDLIDFASDHRYPILLIMLKNYMKKFKGTPTHLQIMEEIETKLLEYEDTHFDKENGLQFGYSDENSRKLQTASELQVGEIVFSPKAEAAIIIAIHMDPRTYFCLTAGNYLVIFSEHELRRKNFNDEVVYQFADYDDLGAFFKRFDWTARRFVRI